MVSLIVALLLSYLAGSIPTSIIVGRLVYHKDPRDHGSGNAGATNTFRVFGWKAGAFVIVVDVGKGALAALLIARLGFSGPFSAPVVQLLAGACAVIGHIWTVFAGFRGGKGVGTAAGMLLGLYPLPFAVSFLAFAVTLTSTGWVSAGSIVAAIVFPAASWILSALGYPLPPVLLYASIGIGALLVFTHRSNIRRILSGTENRFPKLMLFKRRPEGS